jgi:DNA-binding transcriptional LysR family regulator
VGKNPVTIEALETLDAIERRGSFAKAAEELNKATSAVSYIVQKLEEQLDIALFQRQGRRSVLTPAGQLVLAEGREILQTTARLANKAKEVATGWEPRITIGLESLLPYSRFFDALLEFLEQHPSIEIDVCECVLNGGWEALEQNRVDLIVGSPGPIPLQKGYRAIPVNSADLVPVIASTHELASIANNPKETETHLAKFRRVITHDTSIADIARNAGLTSDGKKFYVQTIDQKVEAIRAGIGIGHLPRHRITGLLKNGELLELNLKNDSAHESFIAWKLSNKGKGLQILSKQLASTFGQPL